MFDTFTIAVTGPESTGKSELAKSLSEFYDCPMIPEFAREFLEEKKSYDFSDLEYIAQEQSKRWFGAILKRPKILILDTELTVIKVWSEFKFNKLSPWIMKHYLDQKIDLYLLCQTDLQWTEDPLRENPNQKEREKLFEIYESSLKKLNRNYQVVSGQGIQRIENAINLIESELHQ